MSTFKFHSEVNETVPWQATYDYPSQQTKVTKHLVKLPPKNGATFTANSLMRIEFPSDNYLNALNSTLQFDLTTNGISSVAFTPTASTEAGVTSITSTNTVASLARNSLVGGVVQLFNANSGFTDTYTIVGNTATTTAAVYTIVLDRPTKGPVAATATVIYPNTRLQRGGAHNIFSRLRILYGSLVIEDLQEYASIATLLYDMGVSKSYLSSSGNILDGTTGGRFSDPKNATQSGEYITGDAQGVIAAATTRSYCLNLFSGLLTCKKLIPLKWMSAQVAIELTLAPDANVYVSSMGTPQMSLSNVNYIAEMVEFDGTYDSAFFQGLTTMGVPLKFSSWHYHSFSITGSNQIFQIHERARSVKMALAVAKDASAASYKADTQLFYHDLNAYVDSNGVMQINPNTASLINTYQFRVGGKYYPSQPVRSVVGGPEAF